MAIIKSYSDLEKIMANSIQIALDNTANEIKDLITEFITMFYTEYNPHWYERTFQFLNSCTKTEVKRNGNSFIVSVYIDYVNLDYKDATGYDVVDLANHGYHGIYNIETSTHFWDDSIEVMTNSRYIQEQFAGFLRSKGWKVGE